MSVASCGGPKLNPVHGQVFLDGRPAAGAVVYFYPQTDPAEREDPPQGAKVSMADTPTGKVGADGSFDVTTLYHGRGAPAGRYLVAVHWIKPSAGSDDGDQELAPVRYLHPSSSGLAVEIKEGENKLPPFQLTSR